MEKLDEFINDIEVDEDIRINTVFRFMNNLLLNGDFDSCDYILERLDVSKMTISIALGFLAITLAAKEKLNQRINYYNRLKLRLEEVDPERVDRLLKGLE